ncbi:hypothetical protein HMPREF1556_01054 [Porphyromonas sp. oral taxon 278 str. W7784]|nr:hypothetical protein HMPREF1556_01054 [Porphyromonas sp. oral taxon 278 str. W7784]
MGVGTSSPPFFSIFRGFLRKKLAQTSCKSTSNKKKKETLPPDRGSVSFFRFGQLKLTS